MVVSSVLPADGFVAGSLGTGAVPAPPAAGFAKIRFRQGNRADFYRTVKARVNSHLEASGKTRFADRRIVTKAAIYTTMVVASYALILSDAFGPWTMLALANVFGVSTLLLAINVAHDAAHDALLPQRWLNKIIHTAIFTVLGANAYLWRLRHVKSHHTFPNVNGCDIDIDYNTFVRLSPNQPHRFYHRYQHLYAPFIFWLVDVHTVFVQDMIYLFKRRLANMTDIRHPPREIVIFFVCKLIYLAIVFFVPAMVLTIPWWQVMIGSLLMSFVASTVFVMLLIGTHFANETEFPEVDAEGCIPHDWAEHALVTSLDWSPTSRLANFVAGGANAHAAHHLFPTVCHVHYVAVTEIIKRTAAEFGIRY
ncbi:MAG: fatty acid desaturase family protein, partial [Dongiaceae bacterium]